MKLTVQNIILMVLWVVLLSSTGCARRASSDFSAGERSYLATDIESKPLLHAPLFTFFDTLRTYNSPGKVVALVKHGELEVEVDGTVPAIYYSANVFVTATGRYTNHAYRVHFEKIPFSLIPFHLGAGAHPGVLVIITVDSRERPLMVTTVNTCGCYAATIPTANLTPDMYPTSGNDKKTIEVYGEILPSSIPGFNPVEEQLEILIRPEVHRVMDIRVRRRSSLAERSVVRTQLLAMESLRALKAGDGTTTSFYYQNWPLKGHVKGAVKWWEMLLLGLPSLDLFVGMDKDFGDTGRTGNPFYTSLKPWNRKVSDLNDFAGYLRFNGWGL